MGAGSQAVDADTFYTNLSLCDTTGGGSCPLSASRWIVNGNLSNFGGLRAWFGRDIGGMVWRAANILYRCCFFYHRCNTHPHVISRQNAENC